MVDKPTIGVFVGGVESNNVQLDLLNIGKMLYGSIELHLISTTTAYRYKPYTKYYQLYGGGFSNNFIGGVQAVSAYIEKNSPSAIMNITHPPRHGLVVTIAAKGYDVNIIFRYPGDRFNVYKYVDYWKKLPYFMLNNVVGRVPIRHSDKSISLGPNGKNQLIKAGADREDVTILPPPVDGSRFINKSKSSIDLDVPVERSIITFVGRKTKMKGVGVLESAIPKIIEQRSDLHFVIVGGGKYSIDVEDQYKEYVTEIGQVDPNDVPQYLSKSDLVVLPSFIEGVPRVLIESLFCGTPVIARDTGDVSSVTSNTFHSTSEFIDLVVKYESIKLDDVSKFRWELLQDRYKSFFTSI